MIMDRVLKEPMALKPYIGKGTILAPSQSARGSINAPNKKSGSKIANHYEHKYTYVRRQARGQMIKANRETMTTCHPEGQDSLYNTATLRCFPVGN
jgi:hypothetical protein